MGSQTHLSNVGLGTRLGGLRCGLPRGFWSKFWGSSREALSYHITKRARHSLQALVGNGDRSIDSRVEENGDSWSTSIATRLIIPVP